ncbi:MAG TPA: 3-hydroxyacyl-ACP dehydratase FabZ [Burkholderiales bacterium]|nr:3-hydroxyacyl-ACP dehydratase FabZ [Burkholderiales bacterium]
MIQMNIHQVLEYLPHRYPFLLVDRVLSCEPGKEICALKNVSINEPFFNGHFPHYAVMPGVLIIEALAQAALILSFLTANEKPNENSLYYFVGIDDARFKKPVSPGDALHLHVVLERQMRGVWRFSAQAKVENELVAEAKLLCAKRDVNK